MNDYVHGYSDREADRLVDQSSTLAQLLHHDTYYPAGSTVLEAGCGVGGQTVILAGNSPEASFTSIDISQDSLKQAEASVRREGFRNVHFQQADLFDLPFGEGSFDHVFVCFVLEHLSRPVEALLRLKSVLRTGGSMTVIEGDHGSYFSYPQTKEAALTVQCLIDVQARLGGNALIGRQVYPLLKEAGFSDVDVSARMVYVDAGKPRLVDGFVKKTFIAMVEGAREQAIRLNLVDTKTWEKGIQDLYSTTGPEGTFCYTFFKGIAVK
jgi:ubiquinone/menaquinone biosynthesis C-methylase UbiE